MALLVLCDFSWPAILILVEFIAKLNEPPTVNHKHRKENFVKQAKKAC